MYLSEAPISTTIGVSTAKSVITSVREVIVSDDRSSGESRGHRNTIATAPGITIRNTEALVEKAEIILLIETVYS